MRDRLTSSPHKPAGSPLRTDLSNPRGPDPANPRCVGGHLTNNIGYCRQASPYLNHSWWTCILLTHLQGFGNLWLARNVVTLGLHSGSLQEDDREVSYPMLIFTSKRSRKKIVLIKHNYVEIFSFCFSLGLPTV